MQKYLMPRVEDVKKIIENGGVQALYELVVVRCEDGSERKFPRYSTELLLENWELKEILCNLGLGVT